MNNFPHLLGTNIIRKPVRGQSGLIVEGVYILKNDFKFSKFCEWISTSV